MTDGETTTDLALERTRFASERTLMAWIRTAVSLIGFGFGIPKFFSQLGQATDAKDATEDSPVRLGLMLIALGTLSLAAGMVQHIVLLRRIRPAEGHFRSF